MLCDEWIDLKKVKNTWKACKVKFENSTVHNYYSNVCNSQARDFFFTAGADDH